jgi:hypothetical protein
MYSTKPIHWNIKVALASPGRSRVGPALYVFSLLGLTSLYRVGILKQNAKSQYSGIPGFEVRQNSKNFFFAQLFF